MKLSTCISHERLGFRPPLFGTIAHGLTVIWKLSFPIPVESTKNTHKESREPPSPPFPSSFKYFIRTQTLSSIKIQFISYKLHIELILTLEIIHPINNQQTTRTLQRFLWKFALVITDRISEMNP